MNKTEQNRSKYKLCSDFVVTCHYLPVTKYILKGNDLEKQIDLHKKKYLPSDRLILVEAPDYLSQWQLWLGTNI